jgi:tetratricopeptide (TPR) repeat protein
MIQLLVVLALAQNDACNERALMALGDAAARVQEFDVAGAIARLQGVAVMCGQAGLASWYLTGLVAAREAYRDGGSEESLAPVKKAIAALDAYGANVPGSAQIARLVLLGAASAAQSERDEMAIFLDEALRLESIQVAAQQPGAPVLTAHQAAGDLWLQVHRFEEARRAYEEASELFGSRPRTMIGLARTAARLNDPSACIHYARLVEWWGTISSEPAEIGEARAYLSGSTCRTRGR